MQTVLDDILPCLHPAIPSSLSSLQQKYDDLLDALSREEGLLLNTAASSNDDVMRQANYLQALQLISKFLVGIFVLLEDQQPSTSPQVQVLRLEQTITRCQLLLQVLQQQFPHHTTTTTTTTTLQLASEAVLERSHQEIQVTHYKDHWCLYCFQFVQDDENDDTDDDGNLLLNLDRTVLEQEEQALLQMANTPIPGEGHTPLSKTNQNTTTSSSSAKDLLQRQLHAEWTTLVYQECFERWKRQKLVM